MYCDIVVIHRVDYYTAMRIIITISNITDEPHKHNIKQKKPEIKEWQLFLALSE